MEVHDLLAKLEGVKGRAGSWIARCPAHEDRSPSLTVKELDDGRILVHCFAECGTDAVLGALGLEMTDLFPTPLATHVAPRRAFSAMDALRCLGHESRVSAITCADLAEGKPIDTDRVFVAARRIANALELVHGD
jgi:hypothetical protein